MLVSGDEQAQAKFCRVEGDEVAVEFGPPAGGKIIAEAAHRPVLSLRPDPGPHRYRAAHVFVRYASGRRQ
jgi:hypothetical protein